MQNTGFENDEELKLWRLFKESADFSTREKLINKYVDYAKSIAGNLFKLRTLNNVEYKEYVQYAMLGLIDAVDKYNPNLGASFKTYSSYRIKGSILNGLIKDSELSARINFNKALKEERLSSLVEGDDQSNMSDSFSDMHNLTVLMAIQYALDHSAADDDMEISTGDAPYQDYAFNELKDNLLALLELLPEKQSKIIKYHYMGQLTFDRISGILGVTKGRVSQLHKEALCTLRDLLSELKKLDINY